MPELTFRPDLSFALFVGAEILVVVAFLRILSQRRSPSGTIAWLLAIFLIPYIAAPLFFILGDRKIFKRYQKSPYLIDPLPDFQSRGCKGQQNQTAAVHDRLLQNSGIPPSTGNNRFTLIGDATTAYREISKAIEEAQRSIDICIYQLKLDAATLPLLRRLANKARGGVRVRLLLDSIGSYRLYLQPWRLKAFREAGVQIAFFMPFLRMPFRSFVNLRNHRKILIFDEKVLHTGGINLTSDYLAPHEHLIRFTDLTCRIEGDAIYYFHQLFLSDWHYATKEIVTPPVPSGEKTGEACIQVAPSGPDMPKDALYETYLSMIHSAKEQIIIVTPYFSPNSAIMDALRIALHRGVDITMIVPMHSDHLFSDLARTSFLHDLHDEGAQILMHRGKTLHAKAILFDRCCAVVGSTNFDSRSLFYNYEINAILYSLPQIEAIRRYVDILMQQTTPYRPTNRPMVLMTENLMRTFAPLV